MTMGEMAVLTKRLVQIRKGCPELKQKRLIRLKHDVDEIYKGKKLDKFGAEMQSAIFEEMEVGCAKI